jgi:uncharacterized protein (TIGR03437 family)
MSLRILTILLLACPPFLLSQYSGLATTDDGSQLYFSSPLRLRGSDEPVFPKIFRYTGQFELFRDTGSSASFPSLGYPFDIFQLTDPDVSGDGSVVAYTSHLFCLFPTHCVSGVQNNGNIAGADISPDLLGNGLIRLSGNKQYALMVGGVRTTTRFIDLSTGKVTALPSYMPIGDGRQALTDDGSVLLQTEPGLGPQTVWLWNPVAARVLNLNYLATQACVSRSGAKVVYAATVMVANDFDAWLIVHDVPAGTERVLVSVPLTSNAPAFFARITNDGQTVLYLANDAFGIQQAFLINTDGTNQQQLTYAPEGITEATLSGYGNVAYATTAAGRLLQIDTASGAITELSQVTAKVSAISRAAAGSLAQLTGTGLATVNQVYLNSEPAPVYSASETTVVFQIPWENSRTNPADIVVEDTSASPFDSGLQALVPPINPAFLPLKFDITKPSLALHQDFSGSVTVDRPALPGEIVHFYMTGLGPVTGTVATGVTAPVGGPLQITVNTPTCSFADGPGAPIPALVLFSGLAPGLVGLSQLDLQIPFGLLRSPASVDCSSTPDDGASGSIPVQL